MTKIVNLDESTKNSSASSMKIFENQEFGSVRMVLIENEPWFVGNDVAAALGYKEPKSAVRNNVDEEDKFLYDTDTQIGSGNTLIKNQYVSKITLINESGLYSLVLLSRLDGAKKFKRWITSEVLPSIRKDGLYLDNPDSPEALRRLSAALMRVADEVELRKKAEKEKMEAMERELEERRKKELAIQTIKEQAPEVNFSRTFVNNKGILIREMAKVLDLFGVTISVRRLYDYIKAKRYAFRNNNDNWEGYSNAINEGLVVTSYDYGDDNYEAKMSVRFTCAGIRRMLGQIFRNKQEFTSVYGGKLSDDFYERSHSYNVDELIKSFYD